MAHSYATPNAGQYHHIFTMAETGGIPDGSGNQPPQRQPHRP